MQYFIARNIAATLVERPTSIEEGFPQNAPMVYHFGHTKYSNTRLYDETVKEMAGMVKKRLEANKKARTSGNLLLKRPTLFFTEKPRLYNFN